MPGFLLVNDKLKAITRKDLEAEFPNIDFSRPLEFVNPGRKPDPDNPGRMLEPTYHCQAVCAANINGQTSALRYYRNVSTVGKDKPPRYSPTSIAIKGNYRVDLRNPAMADYAQAYFLLKNPKLGRTYVLRNRTAGAKNALTETLPELRARSIVQDPQYQGYILDSELSDVLRSLGSTVAPDATPEEMRAQLLFIAKSDPVLFTRRLSSSRRNIAAVVREASGKMLLRYDFNTQGYTMARLASDDGGYALKPDPAAFLRVDDTMAVTPEPALIDYLAEHPEVFDDLKNELARHQRAENNVKGEAKAKLSPKKKAEAELPEE